MIKKITLTTFYLCIVLTSAAQTVQDTIDNPIFYEMMCSPKPNYFEVKRAFDLYFSAHDPHAKGSGAKQFYRWQHRVADRLDANGFPIWMDGQMQDFNMAFNMPATNMGAVLPATACPSTGNWQLLGPTVRPYNQSGQPNGTGRINTVYWHPIDSNTIYACSPQGGLWKSTDLGANWSWVFGANPINTTIGVSSMAIDKNNPNTMYIGTGDIDAGDAPGHGVYYSVNGGATWALRNTGMGSLTVGRILIDPNNSSILLAATNGGIYRSLNGGANWTRTSSFTSKTTDLVFNPLNSNTVYAAVNRGLFFRSFDNGVTWTQITSGILTSQQRGQIAVSKADSNYVYFLTSFNNGFGGLHMSVDGGSTFTVQSTTPNILGYSNTGGTSGGQGWYDLDIAANPTNKNEIIVAGVNLWKSTNNGTTWTIIGHWTGTGTEDVHADQHGVEYNESGAKVLVGNDGGVYITMNGGANWQNINNNIANSQIYRMAQAQTDESFSNHGYQDNGSAVIDKNKSITYYGGDGTDAAIDPTDHKYIYGAYVYGSIYRAIDKTSLTTIAKNGVNGVNETGAWVTPFVLQEGNPNRFIAGYKNIWRCDSVKNASVSFTKISNNLAGSNTQTYKYLESNPAQINMLYALRNDNKLFRTSDVQNSSPSWTNLSSALPSSPRWIECHPTDSNIVYLAANTRVYRSTDRGASWGSSANFSSVGQVKCMVFDKSAGAEVLYVGTEKGIYYLTFSGSTGTYSDFNNGFSIWSDVTDIDMYFSPVSTNYNKVVVSTYGRGVWQSAPYFDGSVKPKSLMFTYDSVLAIGGNTTLIDKSYGTVSSRVWKISPSTFTYLNGTDSTSPKPQVQFNAIGAYSIMLISTNCQGSDTLYIQNRIRVFNNPASANCNPTTTKSTRNYGIGLIGVKFADNQNETGLYKHDGAFNDYTSSKVFRVKPDSSYTITVKSGLFNNTYVRPFVDFNNDGIFSTSEALTQSTNGIGNKYLTLNVPSTMPKNQNVRLRFLSDNNSIGTNACQNSSYGDAEDYSLLYDYYKAGFYANNTTACKAVSVTFTDTSEGIVGKYSWDFGLDASPATAEGKGPHNVSYSSTGNKTVRLIINNDDTALKVNYITILSNGGSATISQLYGTGSNCVGDSIKLQVSHSFTENHTYKWERNGIDIAGATSNTFAKGNMQAVDSGDYSCTISNGSCSVTSSNYFIAVNATPVVNFGTSANACFKGNMFLFSDSSISGSGTITGRNWNFGDAGTADVSTLQNPSYHYLSAATFTPKLVVINSFGCKDSLIKTVTVYPNASLAPNTSNAEQCLNGNSFTFNPNVSISGASINAYNWSFGNGNTSTATSPTFSYPAKGAYTVQLVTTTNNGCKDTAKFAVVTNPSPSANFVLDKSNSCFKNNVFTATNTSAINGGTASYVWHNGQLNTSTNTNFTTSYTSHGAFAIKLVATSNKNCKDSLTKNVFVYPSPVASFTINNPLPACPSNVLNTSNGTTIADGLLTYTWNNGNGNTSNNPLFSTSYAQAGNYTMQLIATSTNNCSDTAEKPIEIASKPVASFTVNPSIGCVNQTTFAATATSTNADNRALTHQFSMGDGTQFAGSSLNHIYNTQGLKNVQLISKSAICADTTSGTITVLPTVSALFAADSINWETRKFTALDTQIAGYNYKWYVNTNLTDTGHILMHSFGANANYNVSLHVHNNLGCADSTNKNISINSPNYFSYSNALNFGLFPNPTSSVCYYKIQTTSTKHLQVKLTTIDGKILLSNDFGTVAAGIYTGVINFEKLNIAPGTYPFQIKADDDVVVEKIIFAHP